MGQEILYCWKCRVRILGAEAVELDGRATCRACAPPEAVRKTPPSSPRVRSSARIAALKPQKPKLALPIGISAAALLVVLLIVLASRPAPPPAPAVVKAVREPSPREKTAAEAVAKAKAAGTVEAWQEAVFACEGTSKLPDAKRALAAAVAARHERVSKDFAKLDEEARAPLRREDFGAAIEILEAGRKRRDDPDWRLPIDQRIAEIRKAAEESLPALLERAADLKRRGAAAELKAIEERVAKWGLPRALAALRASMDLPYRQGDDGIVAIEAEGFSGRTAAGGQAWELVKEPAGWTGTGAMKALPERGHQVNKDYARLSPGMEYRVSFVRTGRHYLWVRGQGTTGKEDSLHAGLDGAETPTLEYLNLHLGPDWGWSRARHAGSAPACFEIDRPGVRVFHLFMREDGAAVDRFVITSDPKWTPSGQGPPESPR